MLPFEGAKFSSFSSPDSSTVSGKTSFSKPANAAMSSPTDLSLFTDRFTLDSSSEQVAFAIRVPDTSNVLRRLRACISSYYYIHMCTQNVAKFTSFASSVKCDSASADTYVQNPSFFHTSCIITEKRPDP